MSAVLKAVGISCTREGLGWLQFQPQKRVVKLWDRMPRAVLESVSLEGFKSLRDLVFVES